MSIKRNALSNMAGTVIPLAVSFLTVPLYLKLVGEERYGLLVMAWLLLGHFGLFDLGLSRATAQKIARIANTAVRERERVFWSALALNLGFGFLGAAILWMTGHIVLGRYIQMSREIHPEIVSAIPWLAAAVPVTAVTGVFTGALVGRERFGLLNGLQVLGTVLFQVLPLGMAIWFGPNLSQLIPAALTGRLISSGLLMIACVRCVPLQTPPMLNREHVRSLLTYGGWVTMTKVVGALFIGLDRFVIGVVAGASAVTHYTVPFMLVFRISALAASVSAALFPRLSAGAEVDRVRLSRDAVLTLAALLTPGAIAGMLLIEPFLSWWISEEFAFRSRAVGQIILLGLWSNSLAHIPFALQQARGRPDVVAKLHGLELLPYLGILWLGLKLWGVEGAALAWSLRAAMDTVLLFWTSKIGGVVVVSLLPHMGFLILSALPVFLLSDEVAWQWLLGSLVFAASLVWSWIRAPAALRSFSGHYDSAPSASRV